MSKWKDSLETSPSSLDECLRLQKEIKYLQQENKVLHMRAQGVQVLGKVLQDSQESNARLQKEVDQLKHHLTQKGIDTAQAELSVFTLHDDDSESATGKQGSSCHSSMANSGTGIHDYVNVTTVSGPQSLSTGFPSLSLAEFHIKEIQVEFQHINCELVQLIKGIQDLLENVKRLPVDDRDTALEGKLTRLSIKLNEYAKQARARETLSSALVSEEEQIKAKLAVMEEEQASHENVVQELKKKLDETKEEFGQIQSEIKFFQDARHVKEDKESATAHSEPLLLSFEQTRGGSTSEESIIAKRPLHKSGPETCEGCSQLQRQITELQKQLLATKAEKDEALKLKEEILDVNHKWDAQYKMLAAATKKEIFDLKQQVHILSSPDSQVKYGALMEPAAMEKKALEQCCKQLENNLQQKQLEVNRLQLLLRSQSGNKKHVPLRSESMSMEPPTSQTSLAGVQALTTGASIAAQTQSPHSLPGTMPSAQQIPPEVIDQIEVLKQQLRVYADDFATEREDRERNQAEKEKMREELTVVKEQVQTLEQQVQIYEEDFKREKREKEILQQQLRSNYGGVGYQYQDPLSQTARAEQQARVRAMREVHDRERDRLERHQQAFQQQQMLQYNPYGQGYRTSDQQNYHLVPRGSLPARGPIAHPASQMSTVTSMYRGGEVQPDRVEDVVDLPTSRNDMEKGGEEDKNKDDVVQLEECPRCLRKFDGKDNETILKHIERCIS